MKKGTARNGLFLRGKTWYFRRQIDGTRVAVSTHCKNRQQAERRMVEIENRQNEAMFGWRKPSHSVLALLKRYLDNHCAHGDAEGMSARCECTLCLDTRRELKRSQWRHGHKRHRIGDSAVVRTEPINNTEGGPNAENE